VRVPVGVEDDDGVSRLQVEAETSGASRQQEDEILGVGAVEHPQLRRNKYSVMVRSQFCSTLIFLNTSLNG